MWRILSLLLLLVGSLRAETVASLGKPVGYVTDHAMVLDAETRQKIELQCTDLHQKTGVQLAVVTVHTLEGGTAAEFAQGLSDAWHVGSKGSDKGVVMLFSIDDHKRWINIGYGLEGPLNDAKVGDIGRDMVPLLKESRYGEAISLGVNELSDAISADPVAVPEAPKPDHTWVVFVVLAGFFVTMLVVIFAIRSRRRTGGGFSPGVGFPLIASSDSDTDSFSSSSSSSDSSSSSNDDSSSSSSSSDFGGFDGGSSGGGGAGGDW